MAALAQSDRVTGPYIATAGQTDFPADYPLIDPRGLRVRHESEGAAVILGPPGVEAVAVTEDGFTARLTTPAQDGDRVWVFSDHPADRLRAHPNGGAVRTPTLEDDARGIQAQAQELKRDMRRAWMVPIGETGLTMPSAQARAGRFFAFNDDGSIRLDVRPGDFEAFNKLNKNGDNVIADQFRASLGLSSPVGAGLITFMSSAEGAVRTIFDKLAERISLEDWRKPGDGPFWNAAARRAIAHGQTIGSGIGAYVYGAPGKSYDFNATDTVVVPDGPPIVFALTHNRIWVHGNGRLFELRAWRSEILGAEFQAATAQTSGSEWIYLKGAFTKAIGCRFNGDWMAVRMEGVAARALDSQFDDGAPGGRRIWATGGDTSQIIQGCLAGAEPLDGQPECFVFVDNSAALTVCDSSIISQGETILLVPGAGQGIYSLRMDNLFLDTAITGVTGRPAGGVIERTQIGLTWSSSMSSRAFDFDSTGGGIIDGVTISNPEMNLCAVDALRFVGPNSRNLRVRGGSASGIAGAAFAIGLGAKGVKVSDFTAGPIDGIPSPPAYGAFIDGEAEYEFADCDFSGCGTPIAGYVPGPKRKIRNVDGWVSRARGTVTIASGASSEAINTGLSAALSGKQDIRVWLAGSAGAAGKTGVFVSAIAGTVATVAADPVGATTADLPVCWEASIET